VSWNTHEYPWIPKLISLCLTFEFNKFIVSPALRRCSPGAVPFLIRFGSVSYQMYYRIIVHYRVYYRVLSCIDVYVLVCKRIHVARARRSRPVNANDLSVNETSTGCIHT